MSDAVFSLFTSLRYDIKLRLVPAKGLTYAGWNYNRESSLYMLDYHRDRIVRAATHWQWKEVIDKFTGDEGLAMLEDMALQAIGQSESGPLRVRIVVHRDGAVQVFKFDTPAIEVENLFPERLPPPGSVPRLNDPKTSPQLTLLVDNCPLARSEFTHYKTTSRAMYDAARDRANIRPGEMKEVLVINRDDQSVMEGSTTTPYFWRDGLWTTPPVAAKFSWEDGSGGQDGTSRRWALERGIAVEHAVPVQSLVHGEECWISNGVGGFRHAIVHLNEGNAKPEVRLAVAVSEFEADLNPEQKASFRNHRSQSCESLPTLQDVMQITAEFNRQSSSARATSRCWGTRLTNFLEAVQQYAAIGDVIVGGSQNIIACGVWTLVRMTLLSVVARSSRIAEMTTFFMSSKRLRAYISEYYILVVRFCHKLLTIQRKPAYLQLVSFTDDVDLKAVRSELEDWAASIKDEAEMLRTEEHTFNLRELIRSSDIELHRRRLSTNARVLRMCSLYDYRSTWKEIRKVGTTTLFNGTPGYRAWKGREESRTLVCKGRLGSGKSVCLANIVDDLNLSQGTAGYPVAFFFCRHDISESLQMHTVLASLAHQLMRQLPDLTAALEVVDETLRALDLSDILRMLLHILPKAFAAYFVLDGLDECDELQTRNILQLIRHLQDKFTLLFPAEHDAIEIPEDNPDIDPYITAELERRLEDRQLKAQGMFLWVALQIESLILKRYLWLRPTAEVTMADVVVTYLNYGVFAKQLSKTVTPYVESGAMPSKIVSSLGSSNAVRSMALKLLKKSDQSVSRYNVNKALLDLHDKHRAGYTEPFQFYAYAKEFWLVRVPDRNGSTALSLAAEHGHDLVASLLLDHGAEIDAKCEVVRTLLKRGAKIGVRSNNGRTPLACAAAKEPLSKHDIEAQKSIIRMLIDRGAEVNAVCDVGATPLHWAATCGAEHAVDVLIEDGADIDARDKALDSPLSRAARNGHDHVIRTLIRKGADVDGRVGRLIGTPLFEAAVGGYKEAVQTALLEAIKVGRKDAVRVLLQHGASVHVQDKQGQTPMTITMLKKAPRVYANHGMPLECDIYDAEDYSQDAPVFLYFHPGGLVNWGRDCIPPWLVQVCYERKWPLISFGYRLLPQTAAKGLLEDTKAAYAFARGYNAPEGQSRRVIAGGGSGGVFPASLIAHNCSPPPLALFSIQGINSFRHPHFNSSTLLTPEPIRDEDVAKAIAGPVAVGVTMPGSENAFRMAKLRSDGSRNPDYETEPGPSPPLKNPRSGLYEYYTHRNAWLGMVGGIDPGYEWARERQTTPEARDRVARWPPTVIFHGDADVDVPIAVSEHMRDCLGEDKVSLFVAPGQGHLYDLTRFIEDDAPEMDAVRQAVKRLDEIVKGTA
ncbi:EKC/KEOPS complex subunit BUD32 [Purpureocillium lavendulum]|uniref:EKC/KEOPS complex subunit BUD32 n=1 Tax=Purpureocillium lavendulum TaxID=1247861 RepID=A0AB34FP45_9HYPO|nr:EKC/KEOPS complex subunit BUD32 [Purpureocillium lavendulum]